jgi:hypothetical protein
LAFVLHFGLWASQLAYGQGSGCQYLDLHIRRELGKSAWLSRHQARAAAQAEGRKGLAHFMLSILTAAAFIHLGLDLALLKPPRPA